MYDKATIATLEAAYLKGERTVSVTLRGTKYAIDLLEMKQVRTSTGVARNVIRHPIPHGFKRDEEGAEQEVVRAPRDKPSEAAEEAEPAPSLTGHTASTSIPAAGGMRSSLFGSLFSLFGSEAFCQSEQLETTASTSDARRRSSGCNSESSQELNLRKKSHQKEVLYCVANV